MLDIRTIVLSHIVTDIVCTMVFLSLWRQSRRRFAGLGFWPLASTCQAVGMALIALRDTIPDWASVVAANTLLIGGIVLNYIGLARFFGKRVFLLHLYLLLLAFAAVHAYFAFVRPDLLARTLNVAGGMLVAFLPCLWFLLFRVEPGARRPARGVGLVYGAYILVSAARIGEVLAGGLAGNEFLQAGDWEALFLLAYEMLFILLTYSLVLMVNGRLLAEIQAEEEKFAKAFRSSPYAISLTRLPDGQIVDVNDGFLQLSGYPYAELVGQTTLGLRLWVAEQDRVAAIQELSRDGRVRGREYRFRTKSGQLLTGLFSAEILSFGGEMFALSSIADITDRQQMEEELRAALAEKDILLKEVHHRVKNNLAAISSLIDLQRGALADPTSAVNLVELSNRVHAMSLVHQLLYRSATLGHVDVSGYLAALVSYLHTVYASGTPICTRVEAQGVEMNLDTAIPCGLIVNELVTNAFKYAFPPGSWRPEARACEVVANVQWDGTRYLLTVSDNGVGLPTDFDWTRASSLGLRLVMMMGQGQLNGQVEVECTRGTTFRIRFAPR